MGCATEGVAPESSLRNHRRLALYIRLAEFPNVFVESLPEVGCIAFGHQHSGKMGAAGDAPSKLLRFLQVYVQSQRLQSPLQTPVSISPRIQESIHPRAKLHRGIAIEEISQQVHVSTGMLAGQLNSADQLKSSRGSGLGLGYSFVAGESVVIRNGQSPDPGVYGCF